MSRKDLLYRGRKRIDFLEGGKALWQTKPRKGPFPEATIDEDRRHIMRPQEETCRFNKLSLNRDEGDFEQGSLKDLLE